MCLLPHALHAAGCVQDQLASCTTLYVEEVLGQHFGDLVRFVKAAEAAAKQVGGLSSPCSGLRPAGP